LRSSSVSLLNRTVMVYDLECRKERGSGTCVLETKNMILVSSGSKAKSIPKSVSVFILDDGTRLDGRTILRRPVERLSSA